MAHKRKDLLWKAAVDVFVVELLRFFYPNADDLFDFSQPIEFLDPELAQLIPDSEHMKDSSTSDRLIRGTGKNGMPAFLYLLLEVHDYHKKEINYSRRMYLLFARLFDKYGEGILMLVLYTGSNKSFNPGVFSYSFGKIKLQFEYDVYRVVDQQEEELKKNPNLFALFIRAVLLSMKKGRVNDEVLAVSLMELAREVTKLELAPDRLNEILKFIKLYVRFGEKEINRNLVTVIDGITIKTEKMNLYEAEMIIMAEEAAEEAAERVAEKELEKNTVFVKKLLLKGDYSAEEIADLTDVSVDFVHKIRETL